MESAWHSDCFTDAGNLSIGRAAGPTDPTEIRLAAPSGHTFYPSD